MTREQINRENHCPNFALTDLGDVETGREYKPRQVKPNQDKHSKNLPNSAKPVTIWDYIETLKTQKDVINQWENR